MTLQRWEPRIGGVQGTLPGIDVLGRVTCGNHGQPRHDVRGRRDRNGAVERVASERDQLLKPLPRGSAVSEHGSIIKTLAKRHGSIRDVTSSESGSLQYRIIEDQVKDTSFFSFVVSDGLCIYVNGKLAKEHVSQHFSGIPMGDSLVLATELYYLDNAFYGGLIGRVTVFDRPLSAAEVAEFAKPAK
jgi:hypothetical protein